MTGQGFTYRSEATDDQALVDFIREQALKHGTLRIHIEPTEGSYTVKQRGALHVACRELADTLNAAGLDQLKVLKPGAEIPWTMFAVKDSLYKPLLMAMAGKDSTEEQSSTDPSLVWEALSRHLASKFGVLMPRWPSARG